MPSLHHGYSLLRRVAKADQFSSRCTEVWLYWKHDIKWNGGRNDQVAGICSGIGVGGNDVDGDFQRGIVNPINL